MCEQGHQDHPSREAAHLRPSGHATELDILALARVNVPLNSWVTNQTAMKTAAGMSKKSEMKTRGISVMMRAVGKGGNGPQHAGNGAEAPMVGTGLPGLVSQWVRPAARPHTR